MGNYKITVKEEENANAMRCEACTSYGAPVGKCRICFDESGKVWTISSWFVEPEYQNQGIGHRILQKTLARMYQTYGLPDKIEYIWNGANEYVLNWMERHFDAACTCPLVIQKTQTDDDWSSHIYELNTEKVLCYFKINPLLAFDIDSNCIEVCEGQKRIFHESGKVFTVKERTYDDRDIWTCILENGEEEHHRGTIITCHSSIIVKDKRQSRQECIEEQEME